MYYTIHADLLLGGDTSREELYVIAPIATLLRVLLERDQSFVEYNEPEQFALILAQNIYVMCYLHD